MLLWLSSRPLERSRGETSTGHSSAAPVCLDGAGVGNAASEGQKCYQAPHPHQLFFFICDDSVFSPSLQVLQVIHIFLESDPFK